MGMCGGLSTMSTLALEEFMLMRDGSIAGSAVYCCATFVVGFALAYAGATIGDHIASAEHKGANR